MPFNFPNTTVSGSTTVIGAPSALASHNATPPTNLTLNEGAWQRNTWITPSAYYSESISPVTASVLFANRTTSASYATQAGVVMVNYSGSSNPLTNVFAWFAATGSAAVCSSTISPMTKFVDIVNTSNGDWNATTGLFTVTTPGIYKFTGTFQIATSAVVAPQGGFSMTLHTGSNFQAPTFTGGSNLIGLNSSYTPYPGQQNVAFSTRAGSITLYGKYGDTFRFNQSNNTGQQPTIQTGSATWISIQQLA